MTKLFIQVPCLNEAEYLPAALKALPKSIVGIESISILVIDDGSSDETSRVASENGADYIVKFSQNRGLAAAFAAGLDACLKLGADIIVNTDADNQYDASAIPALIKPIIDGRADVVVGDREVLSVEEFSRVKQRLQKLGTRVVSVLSGVPISDATSGFRAYSKDAALRINLVSRFTYTLESLMQTGNASLALENVAVKRNDSVRPSRLFGSTFQYVRKNGISVLKLFIQYQPLKLFIPLSIIFVLLAFVAGLPWFLDAINPPTSSHIQSTVLSAVFFIAAIQTFLVGILADSVSSVRNLTNQGLERIRRIELAVEVSPKLHPGSD
jgi:glycosyltransferase involved in cell wall biosynthesis